MLAVRGLFARRGQRIWDNSASLQRNVYPTARIASEAGRLTLSSQPETSAELINAGDTVTGEILDENHPIPDFGDLPETKLRVSSSFEETIIATWARVAQESRALGMPMKEDVVGYLQTQAHTWGRDETASNTLLHKYETQLEPEKHAEYGTMPKDVGYAWAHSTMVYRDGEDSAATQSALRKEMESWGWNDAAVAITLGELAQERLQASDKPKEVESTPKEPTPIWRPVKKPIGNPLPASSPERIAAASIHGGGNSGARPPKTRYDSEGWRKWVPLGVAGAVVLSVVGVVWGWNAASRSAETSTAPPTPLPTASAPQTPGVPTPDDETPGESDDGGDNDGNAESSNYSDGTKQMLKVREAKDGSLFVDATRWTPAKTTVYPTFWDTARAQISANEGRRPTAEESVFVTNALLRVNHETEASARRMHIGHDIFLLTTAQYEAAMENANA
jgi:hypothetical protein